MSYTKGKWEVSLKRAEISGDYYITADNDLTILATAHNLDSMENSTFRHEAEANASLIAAAPELLEACKKIHTAIGKGDPIEISNICVKYVLVAISTAEKGE